MRTLNRRISRGPVLAALCAALLGACDAGEAASGAADTAAGADTKAADTAGTTDASTLPDVGGVPGDPDTTTPGDPDATTDPTTDTAGAPDVAAGADAEADTATPSGPVFYGEIQPLLQEHCQTCHVDGGIAPFPLVTYEQAKPFSSLIASATEERVMPPWGALDTDECKPAHPFVNDLRLSEAQIELIAAWHAAGAPEGDPADAVPAKEPKPNSLKDPTMTLTTQPYTVDGKQDVFRCFVLDPNYTTEAWVNGVHFLPTNSKIAHHALLFLDSGGGSAALADESGGFDCFGGGGQGDSLVAAWAPGGIPMELPPDAGMPIPAGAVYVLQMHYHPTGVSEEVDTVSIQLRTLADKPTWFALSALIGNMSHAEASGDGLQPGPNDPDGKVKFVIPAGATNHTESMRFTVPPALDGVKIPAFRIFGVASHMHYVGTDMKIEVDRKQPGAVPCTEDELAPLLSCIDTNCGGVGLGGLQDCVVDNCAGQYLALPAVCGDCLAANVSVGTIEGIAAACQEASEQVGPPEPANECLLQTPRWSFEWQRFYAYDLPIEELPTIGGGDRLSFRCTYDNTLDNEYVAEALEWLGLEAPIDVKLGETTLDEMCLVALQLLYKAGDLD